MFFIQIELDVFKEIHGANVSNLLMLSELCNDGSAGDGRKTQIRGWCWLHGISHGFRRESVETRTYGR